MLLKIIFCLIFCFCSQTKSAVYDPIIAADFLYDTFPPEFQWGLASAAYNYEGGWNEDGKGENIWDVFTHRDPSPIADGSNADVACDSYHKYKEDVQLLKNMGVHFYRFSLSWSRILPMGTNETVNELGIQYYNNLIDELVANDILPFVTIYHWDLPQPLQDVGGWQNETIVEHFANYARIAYERFGDRVKSWLTVNEPLTYCLTGHSFGTHAPGIEEPAEAPYKCGHNSLLAHAAAYRIYEKEFKPTQGGRCGITLDSAWCEPLDPNNETDIEAVERSLQFAHGWFGFPLFFGKYPDIMREIIDRKSLEEGRPQSRLPSFTPEDVEKLQGSFDFLGLNHYTTEKVTGQAWTDPGWYTDQDTEFSHDPSWLPAASSWLKMYPWGLRKLLIWIKKTYDNPEIIITENGFSDDGHVGLDDYRRISYFKNYINQMLKAVVVDGVNVTAYTGWSLLDNFEWNRGLFLERFGVHWVNFTDPNRPRVPKASAEYLKKLFADNGFEEPVDESIDGVFTSDFRWGLATASYQIEGAWDTDGKGENIWDTFCHKVPSPIIDGSTGDVACDSYHKYKEDVQLLKEMGVDYYRFSLSWSRILPNGTLAGGINQAGLDYYNNVIDELIENGIEPMITLYHWDLPQHLEDLGGFQEESALVPNFKDYAEIAFKNFGDRVKKFITFNEPWIVCIMGYATGEFAPGFQIKDGEYNCAHNLLKAHASAYRLYESDFKESQEGVVGITLDCAWFEPEIPDRAEYLETAERARQFYHGWFARPIFSGTYPQQMIDTLGSRLPTFNSTWVTMINGSWDFLGLNSYHTEIVYPTDGGNPGWFDDVKMGSYQDASWPQSASTWLKSAPWGLRKLLNWIKETYGNPLLYVTENGWSDLEFVGVDDVGRTEYYRAYINEVLKAVQIDGCNVKSYTAWSLLDNFEWTSGTSERFGIHSVNFTDPNRPRVPKSSAELLKKIFAENGFPEETSSKEANRAGHLYISGYILTVLCFTTILKWF